MIKRRYFDKLPLQANFYPLPAAAYIEDDHLRLTLLTSTPLGVAALQPGQIEVMKLRTLTRTEKRTGTHVIQEYLGVLTLISHHEQSSIFET